MVKGCVVVGVSSCCCPFVWQVSACLECFYCLGGIRLSWGYRPDCHTSCWCLCNELPSPVCCFHLAPGRTPYLLQCHVFWLRQVSTGRPEEVSRYSASVRVERSGGRITAGARYSASVQICPGAHPASNTMGTGSCPGVSQPGFGVNHSSSSSTEVKERAELHICPPFGPSWPVVGDNLCADIHVGLPNNDVPILISF
jgi:hypothetical protein